MTSNIGSQQIMELSSKNAEEWEIEATVKGQLRDYFRPEFLNRIDETIVFHPLAKEQLTKIVDVQLRGLEKRLASRGLQLEISESAKKRLADEGYDPQFGARPLKRVIQQRIENPLASRLLQGDFEEGSTVRIDSDETKSSFEFSRG
jgi:ATP-dependent Clp protease ATP-binding subunit ClpB